MIFEIQQWHALAKLRLHSDKTLDFFEDAVISLGDSLREFKRTTCQAYHTRDLPKETAARGRQKAARIEKGKSKPPSKRTKKNNGESQTANQPPKKREFNLATPKLHGLADYPAYIRLYGTSDNYTTQIVSLFILLGYVRIDNNL